MLYPISGILIQRIASCMCTCVVINKFSDVVNTLCGSSTLHD